MKRILIVVLAFLILVGVGVAVFVYRQTSSAPTTNQQGDQGVVQQQGGTQAPGTPTANDATSKSAVQAAYVKAIAGYNKDVVTLQNTFIANGYAVQLWQGSVTSGQALLKYRSQKSGWVLVSANGGVWTLQALIDEGVPTSTAQTLYASIPH